MIGHFADRGGTEDDRHVGKLQVARGSCSLAAYHGRRGRCQTHEVGGFVRADLHSCSAASQPQRPWLTPPSGVTSKPGKKMSGWTVERPRRSVSGHCSCNRETEPSNSRVGDEVRETRLLEPRGEDHRVEVRVPVGETHTGGREAFDCARRFSVDHRDLTAADLRDRADVEHGNAPPSVHRLAKRSPRWACGCRGARGRPTGVS